MKEVREVEANRTNRLERRFEVMTREGAEGTEQTLYVEGYAVRFDSPTVLFTIGDVEYKEQIDARAFDEADMSDVIFNYNHGGKVMARTRNKTLELKVDEQGLFIRARLDGTEEGRRLYDEIKGGYIDRMSFAFTVREESYDAENHMWTIRKIKRLYDVSAVDIPAYDDTSIAARREFIAVEERRRELEQELARRKLAVKCKI